MEEFDPSVCLNGEIFFSCEWQAWMYLCEHVLVMEALCLMIAQAVKGVMVEGFGVDPDGSLGINVVKNEIILIGQI